MPYLKTLSYAAAGLAVLAIAPLALPRHVSVERSATLDVAPDAVLSLAASSAGYQNFNPYKTLDPTLKVDYFGPEIGVGAGFHFDSKDGTGSQTVATVTGDTVTYDIDLGPMGQPMQSIRATQVGSGTLVTWRLENDMGFNPVSRVFGLFLDGMVGPTFEIGLQNLAQAAA